MVSVVIGIVVGVFFGLTFLGYKGWILGAVVGGLCGLVLKQINRIDLLEKSLKAIAEKQLAISAQLDKLQKSPIPERKSDASIVRHAAPVAPQTVPAEDELPDIDDLMLSSSAQKTQVSNGLSTDLSTDLRNDAPPASASASPTLTAPLVRSAPAIRVKPSSPVNPIPREPALGEKIFAAVKNFFTEGNPIVRIGMVVMFFGVSFLVKYASSQGLLPIELRLSGVLLGAIALLIVGWITRNREGGYGLVLQGGGIAIIYLTLFAAAKIYGLIPLAAAFFLLFFVVVLGVLLAVLQNAQVLAILATAGGFLAPILTSTGEGSHVGLFSFYLILNSGILAISVYKAWRLLNWVGFMFTFVIASAWGVLKYEPVMYASTQPFLVAFFLLYLVVSLLFSFRQPPLLKGVVDGSLIFGLPLVAFGLQTALLKHTEHGLAISAISLAALYLLLCAGLSRRYLHSHRVLIESFLALGIAFATLAIPLALDASWTAVTWALEATGLVWVGLRQNRLRPRFVGYLLHIAAAVSLVFADGINTGITPIINGDFLCLALLALTSFTIAYLLDYFPNALHNLEKSLSTIAISFGVIWWFVAGILEINNHVTFTHHFAAVVVFSVCSAVVMWIISRKISWTKLHNCVFALLPFITLFSAWSFDHNTAGIHPAHGFGLAALLLFFAVQYRFLFAQDVKKDSGAGVATQKSLLLSSCHILTAWLLFAFIVWEASWQQDHYALYSTAGIMLWFAAFTVPMVLLIGATRKSFWPFNAFESDYKNWVPAPLFLAAGGWFVLVCHKTLGANENYLPILNMLDLGQFAVILLFTYAAKYQFMDQFRYTRNAAMGFLSVMLFVWLNVITLRAMHHYENIPYAAHGLWNAAQVQMALSILWSACALVIMNFSRRLQQRTLWMIGAGLIGLVVLKLFTKDLTGTGTLARIVSFMVVGGFMLLIGYLSPIPSKSNSVTNSNSDADEKKDSPNE